MKTTYSLVAGVICIAVLAGCAKTRQVTAETYLNKSGFLGQHLYERMTAGDEEHLEPGFRWRRDNVVFKQYPKLIIDPVVLYRQPQEEGGGNSNENAQLLIDYLHTRIVEAMSKYATIVEMPTTRAARLQIAVTDYEQSWVALDMVSSLHPGMLLASHIKGFVTEKPAFVGGVQIEFKLTDSVTGKVLSAGIDRRVGGKTLSKGVSEWSDVYAAMDFWALQGAYRWCMVTEQPDCVRPKYGVMGSLDTEVPQ